MSEWTREVPKKPGHRWIRGGWFDGKGPERIAYVNERVSDGSSFISLKTAADRGIEFGPAIPSAEAIEKAKEALREAAARLSAEGYPKDAQDCRAALAMLEDDHG